MPTADLSELIQISRYAGARPHLVQAGGGNTSMRCGDGTLYVKASGLALGEVGGERSFCQINWPPLLEFLDSKLQNRHGSSSPGDAEGDFDVRALEAEASQMVQKCSLSPDVRPSIETLMHCVLGPLTLHVHPLSVTAMVCRSDWREKLRDLFPDACLIDYVTPGAGLALNLLRELERRSWTAGEPVLVFLQNHGLTVSAATGAEVIRLTDEVDSLIAGHIGLDLRRYRTAPAVAELVNRICDSELIGYLSEDSILQAALVDKKQLVLAGPATPDQLVYCGPAGLSLGRLKESSTAASVQKFYDCYRQPPKVLVIDDEGVDRLVILGYSLKKCRDAEEVLKAHVTMLGSGNSGNVAHLPESEVKLLSNWESEKYRQKI